MFEKAKFDKSHRSWHLSLKTLRKIYQALVRSLIEYSSFISVIISKSNLIKLQSIQNRAVKVICRAHLNVNLQNFGKAVGFQPNSDRLQELFEAYMEKALSNWNPLITKLAFEYIRGFEAKNILKRTPCCHVRNKIFEFLNDLNRDL